MDAISPKSYCTKLQYVGKSLILHKLFVEMTGVKLSCAIGLFI
jgi:hypothetical protein